MPPDHTPAEVPPSDAPPSPPSGETLAAPEPTHVRTKTPQEADALVVDIAAKATARDAVSAAIAAGKLHRDSPFGAVRFQVDGCEAVPVWILRGAWEEAREKIPKPAPEPSDEWSGPDPEPREQPEEAVEDGERDLPTIQIQAGAGEITRMVRETIRALGVHDPNIYQRGGMLVRIIREADRREPYEADSEDPKRKDYRVGARILTRPGTPQLCDASPTLLEHVDACSRWERFDARRGEHSKGQKAPGEWVAANPDPTVVKLLAVRKEWPGIRPIKGIIETPCLAPSGRIITDPGYDEETQHALLPSVDIGPIADAPPRKHAQAALRYLWTEMACDFPFRGVGEPARNAAGEDTDPERALQYARAVESPDAFVGISMLLTIFARLAILGAVPGGMFEAASRGSGKSLQMHTIAMVATSRPASVATFPTRDGRPNEEELEKIIMGYAMQASRIVCFDNIKGVLTGATLERAMTSVENIDGRVLGFTGQRSLPWWAILLFSGNNMIMSDDVADRVIVSRVESPREEPRRRPANTFRHPNLLAAIKDRRPRLVRAVLVILRSYLAAKAAGESGIEEMTRGSFEAWARIVPGALLWAGGPDILRAFPEGGSGGDEEGEAHATLLRFWRADWQGQKASYIMEAIFKGEHDKDTEKDPQLVEVRSAVRALTRTREGAAVSGHAFALKLFGLRGRIRDGCKIEATTDKHTKVKTYRMVDGRPVRGAPVVCEVCGKQRGAGMCDPCGMCGKCLSQAPHHRDGCHC